nr:olfactory receptor 51F1-like [Mirounga angustirostris]
MELLAMKTNKESSMSAPSMDEERSSLAGEMEGKVTQYEHSYQQRVPGKKNDGLSISNFWNTTSTSIIFLLTGVPGLEAFHTWISIPFCFLYITTLSGNSLILFAIVTQPSLHEPMYYFLSMLSTTDLGLSISIPVTMLGIFWFDVREISFNACLSQMFFIKLFTVMESSVLLAMAFGRFVAISNPLRYATILTDSRIAQIGVAIVIRGTLRLTPMVALLKRLSFCHSHVLHHSYCFHPDVMKLSCTETRISNAVGLTAMISTVGVDSILILLFYILIIKTVLSIASPEEKKKVFSTCISHIGAVAIFCLPLISLSFVHRFGKQAPAYVHTMIANTYLLISPVMNPNIYSVKTKQIRRAVIKILHSKDT